MVEKITITPTEVRGLGNILSPKNSSDFSPYISHINQTTDTINGVTTTVYELTYGTTSLLLTVTESYVASGSSVTLTATLTDGGEPVENASIKFYKET